ncbi:MAG: N-acetyl-gamma-glutamyl-phosphate reductase [Bacteroidota bacterium]|nr:N-acetyl-gamma-glutamyl-phosphate reductase [Bacteroidota bacterium]
MIKAGIIGGAGYTGGETLRILLHHPEVEITFVQSQSQAGKKIYETHHDCFGTTELVFQKELGEADVIFLCKGHTESKKFLESNKIPQKTKIIDLSTDFRHKSNSSFNNLEFVYGLPELNKEKIKKANAIANPGCFATAIQLALLPLASNKLIHSEIHVNATTGSTGAGQNLSEASHFSWRSNNQSVYKIMEHQHEKEITESLSQLQNLNHQFVFVPQRGSFTRGIYAVTYLEGNFDSKEIKQLYENFYSNHPFVHLTPFDIDVKQVVNTNNCFINIHTQKNKLIIISAIDNLLKGAAGQAVQNMNLMFNFNETTGLKLKPSTY